MSLPGRYQAWRETTKNIFIICVVTVVKMKVLMLRGSLDARSRLRKIVRVHRKSVHFGILFSRCDMLKTHI